MNEVEAARERLREWAERWVSDWYDPVLEPQTVDDLHLILGLPPVDRSDDE
jgi:hypothetical protein